MSASKKVKVNPKIGYYLAGFADGRGFFNVVFRVCKNDKLSWGISLHFNVSQKDKVILALFKRHLGCGKLRQNKDGVWYYEVDNLNVIIEKVIPFFEKFKFLSARKKKDFAKFKKIAYLVKNNAHLTPQGMKEILRLKRDMSEGKERECEEEILKYLQENPLRDHTPGSTSA